jgi:hypothetical protein
MAVQLNSNVTLVLESLTWAVRLFTLDQVQRILGTGHSGPPLADGLIRRLSAARLVGLLTTAVTFPEVSAPLFAWSPDQPGPDIRALAWQLKKRWRSIRPRRVTICWATEKAARLFGGIAPFDRRMSQLEHDLGTASVFTRLRETRPDFAAKWVGEDILRRDYAGRASWLRKIPDAAIIDGVRVITVIEFGGQYPVERIRRFDRHCRRHHLSYELW